MKKSLESMKILSKELHYTGPIATMSLETKKDLESITRKLLIYYFEHQTTFVSTKKYIQILFNQIFEAIGTYGFNTFQL